MRAPAGSAALQPSALGRRGRIALAVTVAAAHLGGLLALAHLSQAPVTPPHPTPIQVSLLAADPVPAAPLPTPVSETAPPPVPAPEPAPAPSPPRVTPPPEPPPAALRRPEPPPPPAARKPPPPKPVERRAPPPVVTRSPTALRAAEEAPPAQAVPAPSAAAANEAAPPPPTVAAAPASAPATAAITAARFDAAYLNNPAPAYPMVSRRMREEGQVMLRVRVAADGLPSRIELRTSSGSERLDRAAQDAVARWRFVPARQGERAVESWVLVPIVFKLQGN